MICPACQGPTRISKTLDTGDVVIRMHECMDLACDEIWTTDQKLRPGTRRKNRRCLTRNDDISNRQAPLAVASRDKQTPKSVGEVSGGANAVSLPLGGVGVGLPSGIDPSGLGPDPFWQSAQEESRAITRPSAPVPFKPRPMVHLGAATPPFMRVYKRYPNPHRMQEAAQVFQDLATSHPGGEEGVAAEIEAAFDAGFLNRHPYSGEQRVRPKFEDFLAGRRWLEPAPAPDPVAPVKSAESFAQRDDRTRREAAERTRASLHRDVARTAETLTTCPVHLYGPREDRKCNKRCPMWEGAPIPSDPIRTLAESKGAANG